MPNISQTSQVPLGPDRWVFKPEQQKAFSCLYFIFAFKAYGFDLWLTGILLPAMLFISNKNKLIVLFCLCKAKYCNVYLQTFISIVSRVPFCFGCVFVNTIPANTEILNLLSLTNPSKGKDNVEVLVMIQMFMAVSHNECISVEVLVSIAHSLLTSDL